MDVVRERFNQVKRLFFLIFLLSPTPIYASWFGQVIYYDRSILSSTATNQVRIEAGSYRKVYELELKCSVNSRPIIEIATFNDSEPRNIKFKNRELNIRIKVDRGAVKRDVLYRLEDNIGKIDTHFTFSVFPKKILLVADIFPKEYVEFNFSTLDPNIRRICEYNY